MANIAPLFKPLVVLGTAVALLGCSPESSVSPPIVDDYNSGTD